MKVQPKISLLIPFSSGSQIRDRTFRWLLRYWKYQLPDAEVVIGRSHSRIFCKGRALNNAARKATGKVLVVLDADTYMPGQVIETCSNRILEELDNHLWYVPYRHLYRLNKRVTEQILASDPAAPFYYLHSPLAIDVDDSNLDRSGYGHRFGAMITIFPRQALDVLGCFDERFKGWGGEDVAFLRALDTLYGLHKTTNNDVYHLWHPFIGSDFRTRMWKGQSGGGANAKLSIAYKRATGNPSMMRKLVDEGCRSRGVLAKFTDYVKSFFK